MTRPMVHARLCALRQSVALTEHDLAGWLWRRLRTMFPDALAAVLMPDHLHLLLWGTAEVVQERLRDLVRAVRRRRDAAGDILWLPVEVPVAVANTKHAARQVRYVHLNPCRDGLVVDPLSWAWSTHRDAIGAVAEPWVTPANLARALARPRRGFEGWLHGYVSADPSVAVAGTPLFNLAPASHLTTFPLLDIACAAAAATRARPVDVRRPGLTRDLFLRLATRDGWRDAARLAEVCDLTPHGVRKNLRRAHVLGVEAAARCLGDPRLIAGLSSYPRRNWRATVPTTVPFELRLA